MYRTTQISALFFNMYLYFWHHNIYSYLSGLQYFKILVIMNSKDFKQAKNFQYFLVYLVCFPMTYILPFIWVQASSNI